MSKLFASFITCVLALASTSAFPQSILPQTAPVTVQVVEYYNAALNKYFMTPDPYEIQGLDSGLVRGWQRTGYAFSAYSANAGSATSAPVCRYYGLPSAGLDSHFYSATECEAVGAMFGASWLLETANAFRVELADPATGACAAGSPVYRLLHTAGTANHRYVLDTAQRTQMIAAGYVSEGYGPDGVIFCTAGPVETTVAARVTVAIDTFPGRTASTVDFAAVLSALSGNVDVARYSWNFGDGNASTEASPSHEYARAGAYNVTLAITTPTGEVETVERTVTISADATPSSSPTSTSNSSAAGATTTSILVTAVTLDTFDFGSAAVAQAGSSITSYAWDFGDGTGAGGPTAEHQFALDGTFPVVLTVKDSKGGSAKATRPVTAKKSPPTTSDDQAKVPALAAADFNARIHAPGVVRYWTFDSDADLKGPARGPYSDYALDPGTVTTAVIDTGVAASGRGSLRFDIPGKSPGNAAGAWKGNFSPDLGTQFGENATFYVQWRQRFNEAMVKTLFLQPGGRPQGGIKQAIITAGDVLDPTQPYGVRGYNSCEGIGVVVQTYYQIRFPISYDSCTGSASHGPYALFEESVAGGTDFRLQNGTPPYCLYTKPGSNASDVMAPGCVGWKADEWMTFKVRIDTGPVVNGEFAQARYRMWIAHEGQPSVLVIDWKPGIPGYFPLTAPADQKFGKVWLLPYMTEKDPTQEHGLAQTWYDELIISTQDIADPAVPAPTPTPGATAPASEWKTIGHDFDKVTIAVASNCRYGVGTSWVTFDLAPGTYVVLPGAFKVADPAVGVVKSLECKPVITATTTVTPTPASTTVPSGAYPAWRKSLSVGQWAPIPGTANMNGAIPGNWSDTIDAWGGLGATDRGFWSVASSGHGDWWNPVLTIDLSVDAPRWRVVRPSTAFEQTSMVGAYYADGAPTARHTYHTTQWVRAQDSRDGNERIMLLGAYAAYGMGHSEIPGVFMTGPNVDGFNTATGQFDPKGTYATLPLWVEMPSVARDPRDGSIYYSAAYTMARWTPKTDTWTLLQGRPGFHDTGMDAWDSLPSLVDTKRNFVVGLIDGRPYNTAGKVRMQRMDIATKRLDVVPVTGDVTTVDQGTAIVHDLDGDRYLYFTFRALYSIDPDTGVSRKIADLPTPVWSVENRAAYFPALGGVAYLPQYSSNVMFLPTR